MKGINPIAIYKGNTLYSYSGLQLNHLFSGKRCLSIWKEIKTKTGNDKSLCMLCEDLLEFLRDSPKCKDLEKEIVNEYNKAMLS